MIVNRWMRKSGAKLALAALSLGPGVVVAQMAPWQNDWYLSFAPAALYSSFGDGTEAPHAPIVITPDGEVIVRTPSQNFSDDQIVRFDAGGNVRWRVNLGSFGSSTDLPLEAMLGSADGGAYVAVSEGTAVARIDPLGNVAWTNSADVRSLALDGGTLVVQSCGALQSFDGASGQLLWRRLAPTTLPLCAAQGLVVDQAGAIYAGFESRAGGDPVPDSLVAKFGPDGSLQWQVHGVPPRVVGVADGQVYSTASGTSSTWSTIALRALDGSVAWQSSGSVAIGVAGSPAEVIVSSSNGLQRLAAQDGSPRWSLSQFRPNNDASVFAYGSKAVVENVQIDIDAGSLDWTATLPASDAAGDPYQLVSAGRFANGDIAFGLMPLPYSSSGEPPIVQAVDAQSASGRAPLTVPAGTQGLAGFTLANAQTVVNVSQLHRGADFEFDLRGLDPSSGVQLWQTTVSPQPVQQINPTYSGGTLAGDALILSDTFNTGDYARPGPGGVWLGAVDLATGNPRWTTLLEQIDGVREQYTTAAYDPIADADGNVIVAYAAHYLLEQQPFPNNYVYVLSVVKLSAADGSVQWRHEETFPELDVGYDAYPPNVFAIGNDIYVGGPFAPPHAQASLLKLSTVDGSIAWASDVFYVDAANGSIGEVRGAADGNLIVTGVGGWAKLDAQSGATLWTNAWAPTCSGICVNGGGAATLPNDDTYYAGQNASRAQLVLLPGAAGANTQTFAIDGGDTHLRQSYAYTLFSAADGTLWTTLWRSYTYNQRATYLAQFDPLTHSLLRQQVLSLRGRDPLLDHDFSLPQAAPQNERLLVETIARHPPQLPATLGAALLDTTVTANGNLSLQFITDRSVAGVGQPVNFHLHVAYSGDAGITGVRLLADFPWLGRAAGVVCTTQGAGNCVLDQRADTLVATFDMQPGGSVDITGQMRTSDGADAGKLSAIVAGPIGLNELDPSDNVAQAVVNQSLFADGFE